MSCFRVIDVDDFVADCILKGADLLSPAVTDLAAVSGMKKGEKVVVKAKSKSMPFAIGKSLVKGSFFTAEQCAAGAVWTAVHLITDAVQTEMDVNTSMAYYNADEIRSTTVTKDMDAGVESVSFRRRASSLKCDVADIIDVAGTVTDEEPEDEDTE